MSGGFKSPDALVALPMKHLDCVGVDADRHDPSKDGVALFNAMIAENSPLPSHPKIDTANSDEHHIFRQPPDNKIGNKVRHDLESKPAAIKSKMTAVTSLQ